jgi:hypothetical protein
VKRNFAHRSVRADKSRGVRENNCDRAAAAAFTAWPDSRGGNLTSGPGRLGPDLEIIEAMFDSYNPSRAGGLAGESFAATLETNPRYPGLRSGQHRALFERLDSIVASHIDSLAGILRGLGFDEAGARIYRSAALSAFRAVLPNGKPRPDKGRLIENRR